MSGSSGGGSNKEVLSNRTEQAQRIEKRKAQEDDDPSGILIKPLYKIKSRQIINFEFTCYTFQVRDILPNAAVEREFVLLRNGVG